MWWPGPHLTYTGITFKTGDSVTLSVTATSNTTGTTTIINNTSGQQISHVLNSTIPLCQRDAEWIVEDVWTNHAEEPFANFSSVTFTGVSATTSSGTVVGPGSANLYDITSLTNDQIMTQSSVTASSVTVKYV
jgi:hypothetical protein